MNNEQVWKTYVDDQVDDLNRLKKRNVDWADGPESFLKRLSSEGLSVQDYDEIRERGIELDPREINDRKVKKYAKRKLKKIESSMNKSKEFRKELLGESSAMERQLKTRAQEFADAFRIGRIIGNGKVRRDYPTVHRAAKVIMDDLSKKGRRAYMKIKDLAKGGFDEVFDGPQDPELKSTIDYLSDLEMELSSKVMNRDFTKEVSSMDDKDYKRQAKNLESVPDLAVELKKLLEDYSFEMVNNESISIKGGLVG